MDTDQWGRTRADEQRFRALFATAYPALHRYGYLRGLTPADIDDLVAEVLTIAWRRLERVPADDPTPWLYAAARNVWRNQLRSTARSEGLAARLADPAVVHPADASGAPSMEVIRGAMAALSDDDHEILRLVAWDGLTPAQAAIVLGCTSTAARVRLHRARGRFARHLAAMEARGTPRPLDPPDRPDREGHGPHLERRSKEVSHGRGNAE